jgi:hypothetical protein
MDCRNIVQGDESCDGAAVASGVASTGVFVSKGFTEESFGSLFTVVEVSAMVACTGGAAVALGEVLLPDLPSSWPDDGCLADFDFFERVLGLRLLALSFGVGIGRAGETTAGGIPTALPRLSVAIGFGSAIGAFSEGLALEVAVLSADAGTCRDESIGAVMVPRLRESAAVRVRVVVESTLPAA